MLSGAKASEDSPASSCHLILCAAQLTDHQQKDKCAREIVNLQVVQITKKN